MFGGLFQTLKLVKMAFPILGEMFLAYFCLLSESKYGTSGNASPFVLLITIIPDTTWYGIIWTTRANQIIEQGLASNGQQIGIHLSTDFFSSI
uniref:Uncharacterized protein n=1 Tax=Populus trichocarpa TaxID=3694 RepID=A0A2K2AX54_POPTR